MQHFSWRTLLYCFQTSHRALWNCVIMYINQSNVFIKPFYISRCHSAVQKPSKKKSNPFRYRSTVTRINSLERQEPRKKPREEPGSEGWTVLWLCQVEMLDLQTFVWYNEIFPVTMEYTCIYNGIHIFGINLNLSLVLLCMWKRATILTQQCGCDWVEHQVLVYWWRSLQLYHSLLRLMETVLWSSITPFSYSALQKAAIFRLTKRPDVFYKIHDSQLLLP